MTALDDLLAAMLGIDLPQAACKSTDPDDIADALAICARRVE
jgi:hypothetical protein